MDRKKAALHRRGNDDSAKTRARVDDILTDWERGTLWAGIVLGVSFALMGLIGGWLGW